MAVPAIDKTRALSDYLAMGPQRSLTKLHRVYVEQYGDKSPAIDTVKLWSWRGKWGKAAKEFDKTAALRLVERTQTMVVSRNLSRLEALDLVASQCLEDAAAIRVDGRGASAQDKKALISAAIEATKLSEVLSGGVSDRTAKIATLARSAQDALSELEARARRKELEPPMIDVTPAHTEGLEQQAAPEPQEPSARKPR